MRLANVASGGGLVSCRTEAVNEEVTEEVTEEVAEMAIWWSVTAPERSP
jgi:hypothetical protein